MRGRFPSLQDAITTKDQRYIVARAELELGDSIEVHHFAILMGIIEETARRWGKDGKFGAVKRDGRYWFKSELVRKEIGI